MDMRGGMPMDPMGMPMMMMGGPMGGFGVGMGMRPPMDMMMGGYGGGFEGGFGGMPVPLTLLPCIQGLQPEAQLASSLHAGLWRKICGGVRLTVVHGACCWSL